MSSLEAQTRAIGGSALVAAALDGADGGADDWYPPRLIGRDTWDAAARSVAADFAGCDWLGPLQPALDARGAAKQRLADCAAGAGIVVTSGQQPGLFGGPLYVLHKALTSLALADRLQALTGLPTAPVFWAATDDTDLAEANHVGVVLRGELRELRSDPTVAAGRSMALTPLGGLAEQIEQLAEASGSAADAAPLEYARRCYDGSVGATVGSAYVCLLRDLLEPLGIAVLDAAHLSVKQAAAPILDRALEASEAVRDALRQRGVEMKAAGHRAQVADVPALSLVFATGADGLRQRVPVRETGAARSLDATALGPNVLLRPIVERAILPTVAYVGGPGEVAYFAQVSAVADALSAARPRVVPRWSGTLIEPHVAEILHDLGATVDDFRDPHAIEGRIARGELAPAIRQSLASIMACLDTEAARLTRESATTPQLARSVESMRHGVDHRVRRLERRYAAAVKQAGSRRLHAAAAARASLFPAGEPQERVLSFVPLMARYGRETTDVVFRAATAHVQELVHDG